MTTVVERASLCPMSARKHEDDGGQSPYEQEVGQRLKLLRVAFGETQEQFGAAIGMSRENYKGVELGDYFPNPRAVRKLCAAYRVDWNWVWSGRGSVHPETQDAIDNYRQKRRGSKTTRSSGKNPEHVVSVKPNATSRSTKKRSTQPSRS